MLKKSSSKKKAQFLSSKTPPYISLNHLNAIKVGNDGNKYFISDGMNPFFNCSATFCFKHNSLPRVKTLIKCLFFSLKEMIFDKTEKENIKMTNLGRISIFFLDFFHPSEYSFSRT